MSVVGNRIKQRRKALGMSAEQLAPLIGVSPATMYRYENGDTVKIPMRVLMPLAEILNTTIDYLVGQTDDPYRGREIAPMEVGALQRELTERLFPYLLQCIGCTESIDEDANVIICGDGIHCIETPEMVETVIGQVMNYFKFLLAQMSDDVMR